MEHDLLDLYRRGSEWAASNVAGAVDQLDAPTPCDRWDTRTLLDHMLDTQRYFLGTARGEESPLPSPDPPSVLSDDPVKDFQGMHAEVLEAFGRPEAIEKTGPALGIAFSDELIHSWDLAVATRTGHDHAPRARRSRLRPHPRQVQRRAAEGHVRSGAPGA